MVHTGAARAGVDVRAVSSFFNSSLEYDKDFISGMGLL